MLGRLRFLLLLAWRRPTAAGRQAEIMVEMSGASKAWSDARGRRRVAADEKGRLYWSCVMSEIRAAQAEDYFQG